MDPTILSSIPIGTVLSLLSSIIGGIIAFLVVNYLSPYYHVVWKKIVEISKKHRMVVGIVIAVLVGVSLFVSSFFEQQIGFTAIRAVLAFLTVLSFVGFTKLQSINQQQLEILREINENLGSDVVGDGGSSKNKKDSDEEQPSGGGALTGAIAGGVMGSSFGPEGTLFGALLGAAIGNELEKESKKKEE